MNPSGTLAILPLLFSRAYIHKSCTNCSMSQGPWKLRYQLIIQRGSSEGRVYYNGRNINEIIFFKFTNYLPNYIINLILYFHIHGVEQVHKASNKIQKRELILGNNYCKPVIDQVIWWKKLYTLIQSHTLTLSLVWCSILQQLPYFDMCEGIGAWWNGVHMCRTPCLVVLVQPQPRYPCIATVHCLLSFESEVVALPYHFNVFFPYSGIQQASKIQLWV